MINDDMAIFIRLVISRSITVSPSRADVNGRQFDAAIGRLRQAIPYMVTQYAELRAGGGDAYFSSICTIVSQIEVEVRGSLRRIFNGYTAPTLLWMCILQIALVPGFDFLGNPILINPLDERDFMPLHAILGHESWSYIKLVDQCRTALVDHDIAEWQICIIVEEYLRAADADRGDLATFTQRQEAMNVLRMVRHCMRHSTTTATGCNRMLRVDCLSHVALPLSRASSVRRGRSYFRASLTISTSASSRAVVARCTAASAIRSSRRAPCSASIPSSCPPCRIGTCRASPAATSTPASTRS